MNNDTLHSRYYTSYTGVSLPLNLVNEVDDDVAKRMTYFIGYYDASNRFYAL